MTDFPIASVTPDDWRDGDVRTPGVRIKQGKRWAFIPADQMRQVADRLHDIADATDW